MTGHIQTLVINLLKKHAPTRALRTPDALQLAVAVDLKEHGRLGAFMVGRRGTSPLGAREKHRPVPPLPRGGERTGERGLLQLRTWTLHDLGMALDSQGKWAQAVEVYQEALQGCRELGDRLGEAYVLHNRGDWRKGEGQLDEAIARYEEALTIRRELAAWPEAGGTLHALAEVYAMQGEWARAAETARQVAETWQKAQT